MALDDASKNSLCIASQMYLQGIQIWKVRRSLFLFIADISRAGTVEWHMLCVQSRDVHEALLSETDTKTEILNFETEALVNPSEMRPEP